MSYHSLRKVAVFSCGQYETFTQRPCRVFFYAIEINNSERGDISVSDVFQVDIHTSAEKNSATNGEVYVVLILEEGIASTAQRDKGDWGDSWEQGETCSCTLPKLFIPLSNIKHVLLCE